MRITIVFVVLALIVLACGGGDSNAQQASNSQTPAKKEKKAKKKKADAPSAAMLEAGATVFKTYCIVCHGADGKLGLNGAMDMSQSTLTHEEMVQVITKGRNAMASYEAILKPDEIEAVAHHVQSLRENK